jgi:hypothetical protein
MSNAQIELHEASSPNDKSHQNPALSGTIPAMKRAGRWLFNFAAVVSAVLCIMLIVVWIRSFWKLGSVTIDHREGTCFWVEVERGQLGVWKQRRVAPATQPARLLVIQSGEKMASVRPKNVITSSVLGFGAESVSRWPFDNTVAELAELHRLADETRKRAEAAEQSARLRQARGELEDEVKADEASAFAQRDALRAIQRRINPFSAIPFTEWQLSAPMWAFVAMTLMLPMVWVIRWRRQRARAMIGMCAVCGYDLRATPERCPECGAIPKSKDEGMAERMKEEG